MPISLSCSFQYKNRFPASSAIGGTIPPFPSNRFTLINCRQRARTKSRAINRISRLRAGQDLYFVSNGCHSGLMAGRELIILSANRRTRSKKRFVAQGLPVCMTKLARTGRVRMKTHKHPKVNAWLAKHPRYHMHITPTYSNSLNQVQRWFGLITQQAIRRSFFRNVSQLIASIQRYVAQYNQHARTDATVTFSLPDDCRQAPRAVAARHPVPRRNHSSLPPSIARSHGHNVQAPRAHARPPCPEAAMRAGRFP
jgi:hypothetical protein